MINIERIVSSGDLNASIYLSNGQILHLPKDTVYDKGLRKGDSLDESLLSELLESSEVFTIKQTAMRFIATRPHSTFELSQKLQKKAYTKQLINKVLNQLSEQGLINDAKYAEVYAAECLHYKKDGVQKVRANLIKRGIKKEIIQQVLAGYEQDETYFSTALTVAKKKLAGLQKLKKDNRKIQESLFRFLMGKGFSVQIIKSVLSELDINQGNSNLEDYLPESD